MASAFDRNFALDLARITEIAALCAARHLGRGDGDAGLQAAVDAVRQSFQSLNVDALLCIGDAEGNRAPLLHPGEQLGTGQGPKLDLALDPVEGLSLLALGRPNAISVAGVTPRGGMFAPGPSRYMFKLVMPEAARNVADLQAPVAQNLRNTARALGKRLDELTVFVLEKPRHKDLIAEIRAVGARILLHSEGDVAGALLVTSPTPAADMLLGVGGTPEAVLTACALRGMGGCLLGRLAPQSPEEKEALRDAGLDTERVYTEQDLVSSGEAFFACSGISTGDLLQGVHYDNQGATTHSLVARAATGTVRFIHSRHNPHKLQRISGLNLT